MTMHAFICMHSLITRRTYLAEVLLVVVRMHQQKVMLLRIWKRGTIE